jgi:DNA-binding response OmpR family regulator
MDTKRSVDGINRVLRNLVRYVGVLWRQLQQVGTEERRILAVMPALSGQDNLRVWSIEEGWSVLFATSVESAVSIRQANRIGVVLYDCDLPEINWRKGMVTLLNCAEPVFAIALSRVVNARFCLAVLESGGYAVVGKPLDRQSLVGLVNGALRLEDSIDSCRVFRQVYREMPEAAAGLMFRMKCARSTEQAG